MSFDPNQDLTIRIGRDREAIASLPGILNACQLSLEEMLQRKMEQLKNDPSKLKLGGGGHTYSIPRVVDFVNDVLPLMSRDTTVGTKEHFYKVFATYVKQLKAWKFTVLEPFKATKKNPCPRSAQTLTRSPLNALSDLVVLKSYIEANPGRVDQIRTRFKKFYVKYGIWYGEEPDMTFLHTTLDEEAARLGVTKKAGMCNLFNLPGITNEWPRTPLRVAREYMLDHSSVGVLPTAPDAPPTSGGSSKKKKKKGKTSTKSSGAPTLEAPRGITRSRSTTPVPPS